jgi:LacI family transcriptional regulator
MKVIKEAGLCIPNDIGVVGFTDEFHATVVDPPLTSVTHPTFEMGQKTAELFFKQINAGMKEETITLKTQLVERASSIRKQ